MDQLEFDREGIKQVGDQIMRHGSGRFLARQHKANGRRLGHAYEDRQEALAFRLPEQHHRGAAGKNLLNADYPHLDHQGT
ncbi:MAG: hypothetical protein MAG471_00003 [Acidimicrobiaceae bacterium]|nr:hypothetical protein [Acidimicrobiaceae bacterium]